VFGHAYLCFFIVGGSNSPPGSLQRIGSFDDRTQSVSSLYSPAASFQYRLSVTSEGGADENINPDELPDEFDVSKVPWIESDYCQLCEKKFGIIVSKHHW
jgi:hypothetical protein